MTDIPTLLRQYGSPLYVYQLEAAEQAYADLRATLPMPSTLYYSLKANPHPALVRALRLAGCQAEVSSTGELDAALAAGFRGADLLFTGPGKTTADLHEAFGRGVRRYSAESVVELRRIGAAAVAHGTEASVLLRVNSAAAGGTSLRMTGAATQFGVDEDQIVADPGQFLGIPGTVLDGLHLFPISNARDEDGLIDSLRSSIALAGRLRDETGLPMRVVDLGGGFATPYAAPGARPVYPRLRAAVCAALDDHLTGWRTGEVEIAFESGRYLVGDSGRLAATVLDVKRSRDQTFVVLDAGIHHLGGMSGLGRLARAGATPDPGPGGTSTVTLVGPLCTPADVLGRAVQAPKLNAADTVVFPNTGAYGLTASLVAFLGRMAPAEVVLHGPRVVGATRMLLSHETIAAAPEGGPA